MSAMLLHNVTVCKCANISSVRNISAIFPISRSARINTYNYCTSKSTVDGGVSPENKLENNGDDDMPQPQLGNPYAKEPRKCILCKYKVNVDFKNIKLLSQFVSPYTGIIYQKHITGLCEHQHNAVVKAVKEARISLLMPSEHKDVRYLKDPRLFNPFRPSRPHPY
ncbi:MRPS18C (predicted) [Pycnogonum litorale]